MAVGERRRPGADGRGRLYWPLSLSAGLLIGIGLSGTSFLGAARRVAYWALPAEQRSIGMGIAAAGLFAEVRHAARHPRPDRLARLVVRPVLALAMLVALIVLLALAPVRDNPQPALVGSEQSLVEALREAQPLRLSGCWRWGFFVCGFQVVFTACTCPRTWSTSICRPRWAPRCWRWSGCSTCSYLHRRLVLWRAPVQAAPAHRPVPGAHGGDTRHFVYSPLSEWSAYARHWRPPGPAWRRGVGREGAAGERGELHPEGSWVA